MSLDTMNHTYYSLLSRQPHDVPRSDLDFTILDYLILIDPPFAGLSTALLLAVLYCISDMWHPTSVALLLVASIHDYIVCIHVLVTFIDHIRHWRLEDVGWKFALNLIRSSIFGHPIIMTILTPEAPRSNLARWKLCRDLSLAVASAEYVLLSHGRAKSGVVLVVGVAFAVARFIVGWP
ncbi:hypothetical protein EJ03DRAFT_355611 [Teratosphaeria nubilosa]|uniref:Uncharacterized protein n=1 Tax=Teratosphaeria nubilosa TaxID=161662 RepID=A0A6G1KVE7_9PEZI|nr:hypothetical protein EJ03DRAFT_355611 [Teratosphaeria nubilosa]